MRHRTRDGRHPNGSSKPHMTFRIGGCKNHSDKKIWGTFICKCSHVVRYSREINSALISQWLLKPTTPVFWKSTLQATTKTRDVARGTVTFLPGIMPPRANGPLRSGKIWVSHCFTVVDTLTAIPETDYLISRAMAYKRCSFTLLACGRYEKWPKTRKKK